MVVPKTTPGYAGGIKRALAEKKEVKKESLNRVEAVCRSHIKVLCKTNLTFDETIYGVGIRSVIAATNKYDGMYDFTAEDGISSAKTA